MQPGTEKNLNNPGGAVDRRKFPTSNQQRRSFSDDNPFDNQQRPSDGTGFSSSNNSNRSAQIQKEDEWESFSSPRGQEQQKVNKSENPFCMPQGRTENPFCTPGLVQNPFNRFAATTSAGLQKQQPKQTYDEENPFMNRFNSSIPTPQRPHSQDFGLLHKESSFDSTRQLENQRRAPLASQYQSKPLADPSAQFFIREESRLLPERVLGVRRRVELEDDDEDEFPAPKVFDYGHGENVPVGKDSLFSQSQAPSFLPDSDDEDDSTGGVTIDYGHGSKTTVLAGNVELHNQPTVMRGMQYIIFLLDKFFYFGSKIIRLTVTLNSISK